MIYEKVMRPNIMALPQTLSQSPFFCMSSWMLTGINAAQSTDMQYIILFSNISNREIKHTPDQLIQWLKLRQMSDESYWCMHVSLDFLHLQEAVHGLGFLPHHVMLPRKVTVHVVNFRQASGPRLNIKTVLFTYGDFHVKDKTAVRTSYL